MITEQEIEKVIREYNSVKTERAKKIDVAEYKLIHDQIDFNELHMDTFFANKDFNESPEKDAFEKLVKQIEDYPNLEKSFTKKYIDIVLNDPFHEYKHKS